MPVKKRKRLTRYCSICDRAFSESDPPCAHRKKLAPAKLRQLLGMIRRA